MDLHNVRESFHNVLIDRNLTVEEFSRKHDVSIWWLYKFKQGKVTNPHVNSLKRLQAAIETELRSVS